MTTCNTSPITPSLAQRLKAARIALPAKQDEIATFWQLANRQVISDWERGKNEIPAEMIPKIVQLEGWAAAGGGLDAARAELARLKDAELAAQLDRVMGKATGWQALGSRPVPLIQSAQLELGVQSTQSVVQSPTQSTQSVKTAPQSSPQTIMSGATDDATPCDLVDVTPQSAPQRSPQTVKRAPVQRLSIEEFLADPGQVATMSLKSRVEVVDEDGRVVASADRPCVEPASQPPADPYKVTIDWEAFVVEVDGVRGVSLRALVDAGLFSLMAHGVDALARAGVEFSRVRVKTSAQGGRPAEDYLMSLRDAQRFCARVRTEVGGQILDLILDHHDEMQRLIAGDANARRRLADAQAVHERIEEQAAVDPILGSLLALAQVRQVQLDQSARIEALEARERIRQEESERMMARLRGAGLPAPTVDAPALTTRKAIVAQMARVGMDAGNRHEQHQAAWRHLYSQYEHRAGVDLRTRAKNAQQTILDYAETHGHLDALYALSCELWPNGAGDARA